MRYLDEFRNKILVKRIAEKIKKIMPSKEIRIMEVCGTHTQSFFKFGLDKILPSNLKLISGPGCPVCVSSQEYIDQAILYAQLKDTCIVTFGDMLRVPGTTSSLEKERAKGANIKIAYSPLDALKFALENPNLKVIFLAVGFETTAPAIALSILRAKKEKIKNLFFFSSLKLIPAALKYLGEDKDLKISGFLCPGHVSTIIGTKPYEFIPKRYKISCCIAGFEPLDILEGIYLLLQQIVNQKPKVTNQYIRVVKPQGNPKAQKLIFRVFKITSSYWRGLGLMPESGLKIKEEFSCFDAECMLKIKQKRIKKVIKKLCRCAEVLKGIISPLECPLFSKICSPQNPQGPCMVSSEGACNAYFRYH